MNRPQGFTTLYSDIFQARYFNRNQKDESQNEFIFGLVLG